MQVLVYDLNLCYYWLFNLPWKKKKTFDLLTSEATKRISIVCNRIWWLHSPSTKSWKLWFQLRRVRIIDTRWCECVTISDWSVSHVHIQSPFNFKTLNKDSSTPTIWSLNQQMSTPHKPFFKTYCTPDQFRDCLFIFLKNYNTLVTFKICSL